MRAQLGEEADAYFAVLEMPCLRGLRLNRKSPCPMRRWKP